MTRSEAIRPETATPLRRRSRWDAPIGIGIGILAAIVGLIMLAWLVLFVTKGRFLKPTFERFASRMSERRITVPGDFQFYFDPIDIHFLAQGLTVANPGWAPTPNFFESRLIDTRIRTLPLIFGRRRIATLVLDGANVDAEWDKRRRNTWTFGDPNQKGAPFQWPVIERGVVTGTTARYVDPALLITADVKVDTVNAAGSQVADKAISYTGDGTMRGKPFTMHGALTTPNSTVTFGRTGFELHARSGPTLLDVAGTLPAATQIEGADLKTRVRGPNLRYLFDFLGVAVPDTRGYHFAGDTTKVGGEWRFTHITGMFGNSDLEGAMTISLPNDRLRIDGDLRSRSVDMVDMAPFMGYDPNALATKGAVAAATTQGPAGGHPRILPDAPLRIDALSRFDSHIVYRVADVKQRYVPLSNLAATFDLDHRLMKLSPMTVDLSGGHLAADIAIDARGPAVLTDYDIRLSPTPLGTLFRNSGVFNAGTTGSIKARVRMHGTGDSLRKSLATSNGRIAVVLPAGTFWTQYVQLAEFDAGLFLQKLLQDKLKKPIQVNCGLIAFTVKDGVAAADPVLIDTDKNVMAAKGGFSFRDESMDLTFRADAKNFSLLSGQAPVGIKGYFAAPAFQIVSPQLIERGAAAVALGVVASPLAAVLAFVDVGDAKGAACGPVLAGATAAGQHTVKGGGIKGIGDAGDNRDQARTGDQNKKKKKFLGIF